MNHLENFLWNKEQVQHPRAQITKVIMNTIKPPHSMDI